MPTTHIPALLAARVYGFHPNSILRLLRTGQLEGYKVGGRWQVSVEALERIRPR